MTSGHPIATDTFLPYMRDVARCELSLRELDQMWRMIEASAKMNCPEEAQTILPTMAATRAGLNRLEHDLVAGLVQEKVQNVLDAIGTQAQHVIDIVVRNLYERTADVGFLATDRELCDWLASEQADTTAIRTRLQQYRAKYSVYDDIVLLDRDGNVRLQLAAPEGADRTMAAPPTRPDWCAAALQRHGYVEHFGPSALHPAQAHALLYAHRMTHPHSHALVGVLCLSFGFAAEMARIFHAYRDPEGRSLLLLLDGNDRVIASSDHAWVANGTRVPTNPQALPQRYIHAGREYLVRTLPAQGYQGYPGPPGWRGQVMVPLELAFGGPQQATLAHLDPTLAAGLLSHARTFSPPLFEVITATESIRRVVWNGQVVTAGRNGELQKLKTILEQISETGTRSNALFSASVRDLYDTVLESQLHTAQLAALLLVDLLDRNLYERANDCRWWALAPELRHTLAQPQPGAEALQQLHELLAHLHRLYTVYSGLLVYDRQGRIVAQSCRAGVTVGADAIEPQLLERVLRLRSEQDYCVTAFTPSPLHPGPPTYTYHAAIRDPQDASRTVGGIAVVFDADTELAAMLRGGLGQSPCGATADANSASTTAFYLDRQGRIISSTDPQRHTGHGLDGLDADVLTLPNGHSLSRIVVHDGQYAILGASASQGYREFKVSDGYRDDVLAVVFTPLGAVRSATGGGNADLPPLHNALPPGTAGGMEVATFFTGGSLLGLPAASVIEALPASALAARTNVDAQGRIGMLVPQVGSKLAHFVWVFDLGWLIHQRASHIDSSSQIITVRHGHHTLGLLIDELHGMPEFLPQHIIETPFTGGETSALVRQFIQAGDQVLIQLLDVEQLFGRLLSALVPARA